eukprot:jgi/Psemu1/325798/estExt_fgenesh1_pg.C_2860013
MVEQETKTDEGHVESSRNDLDRLVEILNHPEKNILPLLYSTKNTSGDDKDNDGEKQTTLKELLDISKNLFSDIESMGKQYQELHEKAKALSRGGEDNSNNKDPSAETPFTSTLILSGLPELHIPSEMKPTDTDLPETIFGQVDLQTTALAKLVKKSTKRLGADGKADDGGIYGADDEEFSDEEAERIRRRMERAMEDMEDEDEASDDEDNIDEKQADSNKEKDLYDPVAEDMNDGFFDLTEMEEFADEEEDFLPNEAFGQPEENGRKKAKNKKSFHQRQREGLNDDSDGEDSDDEDMDDMYEEPWQMRGESKSMSRPVNSLLEGTPEFEMASKQAPIITVEHTMNLEDVIKKRILAEDWDDVVPRELPDIGWNKKRGEAPEVSQEKSKLGLGELYEREYLKKAVGYDKDAEEKQTEDDKAKDEMKQLFANLCSKLDALSNYHFAPRPIADEAEARAVTVPAIAMEEVLPLHVSDARGVAPEEVFATKRGREGILRADHEMDQTDRKRQRQSKKTARRKARKEKEADEKLISRLQPGLGLNNPYEKRKAREELSLARARGRVTEGEKDMDSKYGSSGTFFKRLQAEAQQTVHDRASGQLDDHTEKKSNPRSSAYKL